MTESKAFIRSDGSVQVSSLCIPPSGLSSPQFREFYAPTVAEGPEFAWPIPARTAPRPEWDKFDAWVDRTCNAAPLAAALERYPVDIAEMQIAGVHVATVVPKHGVAPENEHRVLINLHSGSFVMNRGIAGGLLESVPIAASGRLKVVTLDHRQAPFHSYPAASEDVQAVYESMLRQHSAEAVGIYGCSAGGALTTQAVARFQSLGLPLPGAIGIFNIAPPPPFGSTPPWGHGWGDSGMWYSGRPRNQPTQLEEVMGQIGRWYMEAAAPDDIQAYPATSDEVLGNFPPTLFLSGTRDFALSGIIHAHTRLLKLGVDAALYVMEGCPHAAHVMAVGTPEADDAQRYVARWFQENLGPSNRP